MTRIPDFNFINLLRQQESVKGFPGEVLPSTAFYFSRQSITDWTSLLSYGDMQHMRPQAVLPRCRKETGNYRAI